MSRVLITGAGGNLGKACVDEFLKKGFEVIGTVSPGKKDNPEKNYQTVEIDLTNEQQVNEALTKVLNEGPVTTAVLTVGGFAGGKIIETNGTKLRKMMTLNFDTTFFVSRILFEHMMANKSGRMVFIGSRPALIAEAGKDLTAYALSKSLVFKLAEMMNAEGRNNNIHITVIAPGTIDTPDNRKWKPDGDPSWVTPEEIAKKIFDSVTKSKPGDESIVKMYAPEK